MQFQPKNPRECHNTIVISILPSFRCVEFDLHETGPFWWEAGGAQNHAILIPSPQGSAWCVFKLLKVAGWSPVSTADSGCALTCYARIYINYIHTSERGCSRSFVTPPPQPMSDGRRGHSSSAAHWRLRALHLHAHCRSCSGAPEAATSAVTSLQDELSSNTSTDERASTAHERVSARQLSPCAHDGTMQA